jgi:hypothetical protein
MRRPYYLSAPGDVLALETEAEAILDLSNGSPVRSLLECARLSHDLATMVLYRHCFRGENGEFLRRVDGLRALDAPLRHKVRVLVVPGMHFLSHPETGADGRLVIEIGRRLGADVSVVQTDPRGATASNGAMIAGLLPQLLGQPHWVVSVSKGTADLRAALCETGGWPTGILGWVNLSGLFQGSPVADRFTGPGVKALAMRTLASAAGHVSRDIKQLRTDSPLWNKLIEPPTPDCLIHVVGFPPSWSIEMRIARHYRWLSEHFGPNDGIIPLIDCFDYPGRIYPIWGADHFMRVPDLARFIYLLFHFMDDRCPPAAGVAFEDGTPGSRSFSYHPSPNRSLNVR